jgi:DNA-binding NarL/FixJ family response regulator
MTKTAEAPRSRHNPKPPSPALTNREAQLVTAVARGLSNREIAQEFDVSVQTIKNQLSGLYQKLGIGSRLKLVVLMRSLDRLPGPPYAGSSSKLRSTAGAECVSAPIET